MQTFFSLYIRISKRLGFQRDCRSPWLRVSNREYPLQCTKSRLHQVIKINISFTGKFADDAYLVFQKVNPGSGISGLNLDLPPCKCNAIACIGRGKAGGEGRRSCFSGVNRSTGTVLPAVCTGKPGGCARSLLCGSPLDISRSIQGNLQRVLQILCHIDIIEVWESAALQVFAKKNGKSYQV